MRAVAEVVGGQQVEVVHNLDDVGGADFAHLVLLVVQICDFFVDALPSLTDEGHIGHAVQVAAHIGKTDDNGLDFLIAEDAPWPAAPGLLHAGFFAAHIVPGGVNQRDAGVFRRLTGGENRNAALAAFIAADALGQHVADLVGVHLAERVFGNRHQAGIAINVDNHVFFGFA